MAGPTYESDFAAWAFDQAARLRAGEPVDIANVAEELEDLGKQQRQRLESHLMVLLTHMLKWDVQTNLQSRSWDASIREHRRRTNRILRENPSLKHSVEETVCEAYRRARVKAIRETGLDDTFFTEECPYSLEEILN
jgi:hypothetical protein